MRAGLTVLSVALALTLAGCMNPEYRFVSSTERDVVVRVPWSWTRIDRADVLRAQQGDAAAATSQESQEAPAMPEGSWMEFYDGARRPNAAHLVADSVSAPVVMLQSGEISEAVRASVTPDALRNLFLPVTETARKERNLLLSASGQSVPKFRLLGDHEVRTKTATGVRVVFGYDHGRGEEIFSQVILTDPKHMRWHAVLIHCSAACYADRRGQIAEITTSFTIKPQ